MASQFFVFFFLPCCLSFFLCFSRITWAMGVFNFFSERFCFIFCFFHVHEDASGRLLIFSFLRFWDVIIWLGDFFSPHSRYKIFSFYPYPFFVDHDGVKIQYALFSRVYWCGVVTKGCRRRVRTDSLVRRKHWETSSIRMKDCDRRYIPQVSSAPIFLSLRDMRRELETNCVSTFRVIQGSFIGCGWYFTLRPVGITWYCGM